MRSSFTAALVVLAVLPATAAASPATPLLRIGGFDTLIAISGDEVLVGGTSASGAAQLRAVPATGGAPVTRFLARAREGFSVGLDALDASAERVAFILRDDGPESSSATAFVGPPSGPFRPVTTGTLRQPRDATGIDVDGARVLLLESDSDANSLATVIDADGSRTQIPLPDDVEAVHLAGDLIGISSDSPSATHVRVRLLDRGTGALRWRAVWDGGYQFALRADGLIASIAELDDDREELFTTAPGQPLRALGPAAPATLDDDTLSPQIAGDGILVAEALGDEETLVRPLVLPTGGGPPLPAGPATDSLDTAAISDRWVAWMTNECVAAVPRAALPAAEALGPGPCPRAELALDGDVLVARNDARRIEIPVRCATAPPPGCDTDLQLKLARSALGGPRLLARIRTLVPPGPTTRVAIRLSPTAFRYLRRAARRDVIGTADIRVVATVAAPGGPNATTERYDDICAGRCR